MFTGKTMFCVRADLIARENLSFPGTPFTFKPLSWSSAEELLQASQFVESLSSHQRKYASTLSNSHYVKNQSSCHKSIKEKKQEVTNPLLKPLEKANSCLLWQVTFSPQVEVFCMFMEVFRIPMLACCALECGIRPLNFSLKR